MTTPGRAISNNVVPFIKIDAEVLQGGFPNAVKQYVQYLLIAHMFEYSLPPTFTS